VVLIVPRWSPPVLARRRLVALLAGTAALGGAGVVIRIVAKRAPRSGEHEHLTLGVGPFRSSAPDPARAWIGPALRDGLDTQLSGLSGVRVFSQEFIDFVMTRQNRTAIEVANRLGIEKMVSGSVLVVGDTVRVEARIVDVGSGILEGAYVATGPEHDFLAVENDLVSGVIAQLHLQLSAEDERRLSARRATDVNALRRLRDVEQGSQPSVPPQTNPTGTPDGESWLRRHVGARTARADDAETDVRAFLDSYRRATEKGDVAALATMYSTFTAEQRAGLERFFGEIRDLRVQFDQVEVAVVGDEAVVSYTRTDDFVDVQTGRPEHVSLRLTKTLRRVEGRWRFAST
jgi:TolB-like protein/ketosteroid isomerase-like protein